jgi:ATP-dependent Clp protease adapter protein ClpS
MSEHHADRPEVPRLPGSPRACNAPQSPPRLLRRYQVILHRDARQDLMFVVRSVMELTRFPRAEATHKMWQAHHSGRAVVLVTYLERAELYAEQFVAKGLLVSVEPA